MGEALGPGGEVMDRQIVDPSLMVLMARLWNAGVGTDKIAASVRYENVNEAWVYNRLDMIKLWAARLRRPRT